MLEDSIPTIFNYGFPSAIAGYVIIRMESTMGKLTEAVVSLKALVESNIK